MPAPHRPNTAAANAARRRAADERAAARLRTHGWLVIPPEGTSTATPAELAREVLYGGNAGEAENSLHRLVPKLAGVAQALRALDGADPAAQRVVGDLYRRMLHAIAGDDAAGRR